MEGLDNKQYPTGNGVCNGTDDAVLSNTVDLPNAGYFEVTGAGNVKFDPIQGAAGRTRAFAAGAVLAAGIAAVQLATALALDIPQFKKGVIDFQGKGTETSDSNLVII